MGAWIETYNDLFLPRYTTSHPIWVRGLKHNLFKTEIGTQLSHPIWVRGLKPRYSGFKVKKNIVAPYMGAWIETADQREVVPILRRTLYGCVD